MSKRKSFVALAASAVMAVGIIGLSANADDMKPFSVLNDGMDKIGAGKPMADLGIKIGGFVEGSYTYNFRAPNSGQNEGRAFDSEHNAARLNQLALQIGKNVDIATITKSGKWDWGFGVDMLWGADGRSIHSNGLTRYSTTSHPINQYDLTQAYVDIAGPVGNGLVIRIGKFITPIGYEVISPVATVLGGGGNNLFSHSYSFGFGIPFTHTGITATYKINDKMTVMAGITRGWEQSTRDVNGAIDFLGNVTYKPNDETTIAANVSVGPQAAGNNSDYRYLVEAWASFVPAKSPLSYGVDAQFAWEDNAALSGSTAYWWGATGYVGYKLCDMATLNGRVELFRDDGGSRLGVDGTYLEGTIGVTIKPMPKDKIGQNLIIRPELRGDWCNKGAFNGGASKSQATFGIDVVFSL